MKRFCYFKNWIFYNIHHFCVQNRLILLVGFCLFICGLSVGCAIATKNLENLVCNNYYGDLLCNEYNFGKIFFKWSFLIIFNFALVICFCLHRYLLYLCFPLIFWYGYKLGLICIALFVENIFNGIVCLILFYLPMYFLICLMFIICYCYLSKISFGCKYSLFTSCCFKNYCFYIGKCYGSLLCCCFFVFVIFPLLIKLIILI